MVRQHLVLTPLAKVREMMRSVFPVPNRTIRVPVAEAAGRITAGPVYSRLTHPIRDISARDGFAIRSRETAGASGTNPVRLTDPYWVNTGNAIPPGYDAVVMVEDVIAEGDALSTGKAVSPGEHIHPAGSEIREGEMILPAGHWIRPCDIGALLTYGITTVDAKEVRIGLIPTGSELVPAGEVPGPGQVIESNTAGAAVLLGETGATCTRYEITRDDPHLLRAAIERGVRENDLLIVSAGSSAGRRDFTARIIDDLGEVLVHGIAMKPGTPSILGRIDDKPVIGVPGYPIAAMTAVRELAFPLLAEWGFRTRSPETLRARLVGRVTSDPGYDEFLLLAISRAGNRYIATPLPRKSHTQMVMVRGNAYLHIPAGVGCIEEETEVEVTLTGPCWTIREARSPPT